VRADLHLGRIEAGDDRVAASEGMLLPRSVEHPLGGMALLSVDILVAVEPRVDNFDEPFQLRPPDRGRPPVGRGRRKGQWPRTRSAFRDDGHYVRPQAMELCDHNGVDYVFGLSGSKPLARKIKERADEISVRRAAQDFALMRGCEETRHRARSWNHERRAVARIEATRPGLEIRFVVTSIETGSPAWVYDELYCARGHAPCSNASSAFNPATASPAR